jgi:hypothetical protein
MSRTKFALEDAGIAFGVAIVHATHIYRLICFSLILIILQDPYLLNHQIAPQCQL